MKAICFEISWVLHGVLQYKVPQSTFSPVFCLGNYQKVDLREHEVILKVGEGYTNEVNTYHSYGLRIALWVLEMRLGVRPDTF